MNNAYQHWQGAAQRLLSGADHVSEQKLSSGASKRLNSAELAKRPHGRCPKCKHVFYNHVDGQVCRDCKRESSHDGSEK
jgi:hypothetical protein